MSSARTAIYGRPFYMHGGETRSQGGGEEGGVGGGGNGMKGANAGGM